MDGEEWARQEIMEYERANQMIIRTNTAKAVSWPTIPAFFGMFPRILPTHALPR